MSDNALLAIDQVTKTFPWGKHRIEAVRRVSLSIGTAETLGLVGESGSGKSTLGRLAIGLLAPDRGTVTVSGVNLGAVAPRTLRTMRQTLQIVFQDPGAALNARVSVAANILEPLVVHNIGTRDERLRRVGRLLERVGLTTAHGPAMPDELSGGQLQRVMIARALALGPKLLVCDEILSALDLSVQAQVLSLLDDLRTTEDLAYLFISHNLSAVAYLSDRIGVMYLGELVEWAPTAALVAAPKHPYTQALFQSILEVPVSKAARKSLTGIPGEVPSAIDRPSGCAFHTRCPLAMDICRQEAPPWLTVGDQHQAACHALAAVEEG